MNKVAHRKRKRVAFVITTAFVGRLPIYDCTTGSPQDRYLFCKYCSAKEVFPSTSIYILKVFLKKNLES